LYLSENKQQLVPLTP